MYMGVHIHTYTLCILHQCILFYANYNSIKLIRKKKSLFEMTRALTEIKTNGILIFF